jgi:hypothetical protein
MPWKFRVWFRSNYRVHSKEAVIRVRSDLPVELAAARAGSLAENDYLILRCGGLPDRETAERLGRSYRDALLSLALELGIAVDVGSDRAKSSIARSLVEEARAAHGIEYRPTVHGLDIYEETACDRHLEISVAGFVSMTAERVIPALSAAQITLADRPMTDSQRLAIELLNLSRFEASPRAQFLTCIAGLEVLAPPQRRDTAAIAVLDDCRVIVKRSSLATPLKDQLLGSLRYDESVGAASGRLVRTHLGSSAEQEFKALYRARSELTHTGRTKDVPTLVPRAQQMLTGVLRALLGLAPGKS